MKTLIAVIASMLFLQISPSSIKRLRLVQQRFGIDCMDTTNYQSWKDNKLFLDNLNFQDKISSQEILFQEKQLILITYYRYLKPKSEKLFKMTNKSYISKNNKFFYLVSRSNNFIILTTRPGELIIYGNKSSGSDSLTRKQLLHYSIVSHSFFNQNPTYCK